MYKKVGVFDSGVGGLSVVNAIKKAMPELVVIYADDKQHIPYGNRNPQEIYSFVEPILQDLVKKGCDVIVIACNTVTTTLINDLRKVINIHLIGMEPMIKPAAKLTKNGVITVCATPATLASKRYLWLKKEYANNIKIIEPDCSDWSQMIQNNQIDRDKITKIITKSCNKGSDVVVLGCTHYHWIEDLIKDIAKNKAKVIQPEQPVIEELKRILQQKIK